jgi:hypothetical protein
MRLQFAADPAAHVDRQAFPRALVDNRQALSGYPLCERVERESMAHTLFGPDANLGRGRALAIVVAAVCVPPASR